MEYQDFESAMKALEEIVGKLEAGDLPLEQALALFEEGVQISRFCNSKLDAAERRVEILLKNEQGELKAVDFAVEDGEQE
jgi:exodeoxyribonuclease VII small subunit